MAQEMYWGGGRHFSKGHVTWTFSIIFLPCFLRCAKVWLLKNNFNLFGLNDKLLIHTVRTHVINYDCVFFIQNSFWGNSVSSDCLQGEGAKARNLPTPCHHILGPLVLGRKHCRGRSSGERETVHSQPRGTLANAS